MLIAMVVIFDSLSDSTITYRPYNNIALFTVGEMVIHGENNSPMLVVSRLERVIEVSMWGNIAIEETDPGAMTYIGASGY
jgi:oligosaccharyltransferase complex subunit alpha (ribophorin I)